jgi:phosphoglycolate phosphatase
MGSPSDYDAWLFDLDGTLVDTEWSYTREVFDRVGDRMGREFTDREAEILWHGLGGSRNERLRSWGFDPTSFWEAFHDVEDPETRAEATYLYDAAAHVADIDGPVGVVTHCAEFLADPVMENLDIADWFDVVLCCDDETGWKPDPRPLELALGDVGLEPATHHGVYVGDAASDVGAAMNAGLDAVHVERHAPEKRGHCVLGDYRVESFDEVFDPQAD